MRDVLAQLTPGATTLTPLYTVPYADDAEIVLLTGLDMTSQPNRRKARGGAQLESIAVCNFDTASTTFRLSIARGGEADATKQYIYRGLTIDGGATLLLQLPIPVVATDVVRVYSGNASTSITLIGLELPSS